MIRNYLLTAWRSLLKNRVYTTIHVLGLMLGISTFILLGFYAYHELNKDRHHKEGDSTYRLYFERGNQEGKSIKIGLMTSAMTERIGTEIEGIEGFLRIRPVGKHLFQVGDTQLKEGPVVLADAHLHEYFALDWLEGDKQKALSEPNSVVLEESVARKLFGEESPLGKSLQLKSGKEVLLQVSGVVKDRGNSHLKYGAFVSWETRNVLGERLSDNYVWSIYGYVKTTTTANQADLEEKINTLLSTSEEFKDWWDPATSKALLQPMHDIYLGSSDIQFTEAFGSGSRQGVYLLIGVAILLLLIACINYINISTARAGNRSLEVGVRKVLGANQQQLVGQFMSEAFLITFFAVVLSALVVELALPGFNQMLGSNLQVDWLLMLPVLGAVLLLVSILSGMYPSFVLSAFLPITTIKRKRNGKENSLSRQALLVFQFVVSLVLITVTVVMLQQTRYIAQKELGFNKDQVLVIDLGNSPSVIASFRSFQEALEQHSGIIQTTASTDVLGNGYTNNSGMMMARSNMEKSTMTTLFMIDPDFVNTYELEIIQGEGLRAGVSSDSSAALINETLARNLGLENPIGEYITYDERYKGFRVVGVVKDFYFQDMYKQVQGAMLTLTPNNFWYLSVRINPEQASEAIAHMEAEWKRLEPNYPFEYQFVDKKFARFYQKESRLLQSVTVFSFLSILVACLGLYGLTTFVIENKIKEIGIRKVLGSSLSAIVLLVNKPFLRLFVVSVVASIPLAWYFLEQWLSHFAYHVPITLLPFTISALVAFVITLITVSVKSVKAAQTNPVEALKSE